MIGRRAPCFLDETEEEIRSIAGVAQPQHALYAVRRDVPLDRPCFVLIRLARLALADSRDPARPIPAGRVRSYRRGTDKSPGYPRGTGDIGPPTRCTREWP